MDSAGELSPEDLIVVREGTPLDDHLEPLSRGRAARVKSRLIALHKDGPDRPSPGLWITDTEDPAWLIEGLWQWGTIPILGGNPKAGKTTLAIDLTASLLLLDRPFLGKYSVAASDESTRTDPEERAGWTGHFVHYINAETPKASLEGAMRSAGIGEVDEALTIDHLEAAGGPEILDLTDPVLYELWLDRIVDCRVCNGSDDWAPTVVLVDGLTAILNAAGKGTEHYAVWYAAFRRLMREAEVPNALVIAHNTMEGSHLMGGVEAQSGADGLWTYSTRSRNRPGSQRLFSVRPRLGGVVIDPTPVELRDGRLRLSSGPTTQRGAGSKLPSLETLVEVVRLSPGATRREIESALGCSSWELRRVIDAAESTTAIVQERCGPSCNRCPTPSGTRVHFYARDRSASPHPGDSRRP
jgi:hypothetical protein